ncbi:CotY/CotZ family spore coat protein [Ornithinibacillus halophilus]|uniref:Spore coat protein Z n=1 Tax=Ornithinibacillus halophilus TaxID=930117 RepID=A0A1M5KNK7_9BACI|nr:CotY/CotZ family spore coat protein [Ornithinibacillus halophilus]SHG54260.1 spore coat protein Z [Ornithinibacillus halophilus]
MDRPIHKSCYNDNCVCETVEKIIEAQDKVAAATTDCTTSCHQSVRDLLSPAANENDKTTVPFILYCKGNCKPFIASGVHKSPIEGYPNDEYFKCIETPVFRAKRFTNRRNCCVLVELLRPVNANGYPIADKGEKLCDFFQDKTPHKTIHFQETGICITLDLKEFMAILCLDAIRPLS